MKPSLDESAGEFAPLEELHPELPAAVALQVEAGRRLGLTATVLDPEYGYLFELRDGDGRRTLTLLGGRSPLNDAVAARLAEDKFYTTLLLERGGFRVPRSARCLAPGYFLAEDYEAGAGAGPALALAAELGYPLMVKPNRGSHGRDVVEVAGERELTAALERAWRRDGVAVAQERITGPDLRLDFLDGAYLLGYERYGLRVTGDGRSTVRRLVEALDARYRRDAFWTASTRHAVWRERVEARDLTADSVLAAGETLDLGETVLNLNQWATARLLREVPAAWESHGLAIGRLLGLRHFGIDFKGASLEDDPASATVLEVNASPLLVQTYRLGHHEAALTAQTRILQAALEAARE